MTKQQLEQLEQLLEKFDTQYSDEIHNDRFLALTVVRETVNGIVLSGKYERDGE